MRRTIVEILKKAGEKTAEVPVNVKCWPGSWYQPKMPKSLRDKMLEK